MGVARLPLYLKSSKSLWCLFDYNWCTRLWCVFELAVYLRLRKDPVVHFWSISQITTMFLVCWASCFENLVCVIYIWIQGALNGVQGDSTTFKNWWSHLSEMSIGILMFILGQLHFLSRKRLRKVDEKIHEEN